MLKFVAVFAALCSMGSLTLAQTAKPRIVELHPGEEHSSAIVIPAASPLVIASIGRDREANVAFSGRVTLSGDYELDVSEDEYYLRMWPDKKSRAALPYWRDRGAAEEIYISNGQAFAEAVLSKARLEKLKAEKDPTVRGRVTIIADDYNASIECDAANFSARFVALEKVVRIAAKPRSEQEC